jgi:hypothetical protein
VPHKPWIGSPVVFVIATSFAQAEIAVYGSANHIRVAVILPVVLPPADLAQLQGLRQSQSPKPATRAAGRNRCSHPLSMRWMEPTPGWLGDGASLRQ